MAKMSVVGTSKPTVAGSNPAAPASRMWLGRPLSRPPFPWPGCGRTSIPGSERPLAPGRRQVAAYGVRPLILDRRYPNGYDAVVVLIRFLGDAQRRLRAFPAEARLDAGFQLWKVQCGEPPDDFKPMPSIGRGVEEIRVRAVSGTFRVVYLARRAEAVYVLHAFAKKTRATAQRDIELARKRLNELTGGRHEEADQNVS